MVNRLVFRWLCSSIAISDGGGVDHLRRSTLCRRVTTAIQSASPERPLRPLWRVSTLLFLIKEFNIRWRGYFRRVTRSFHFAAILIEMEQRNSVREHVSHIKIFTASVEG